MIVAFSVAPSGPRPDGTPAEGDSVSEAVAAAVADVDDIVVVDPREVLLKGFADPQVVSRVDWAA